ncbi:PEP-CTERM sorting domain-containing protein [Microcystis aeruginosa]|uniref:PEP-CTERM sorting domain-containing protein n=1 Tax=Microcystis aeruginosa TaxID=1126 RepID=UPI00278BFD6D|nr:PEP-CTERM sorting domain-containing protein [Microcystis aeruginosa]
MFSSFIPLAQSNLTATVKQPISVPEPSSSLAILVAGTAVGLGAFSKRKLARSKNK